MRKEALRTHIERGKLKGQIMNSKPLGEFVEGAKTVFWRGKREALYKDVNVGLSFIQSWGCSSNGRACA